MGTLISAPATIIVTPPSPAFLGGLSTFQCRELVGATYGPSGAIGKVRPLDAALQGWDTKSGTSPSLGAAWLFDYSGGAEDRANRRVFFAGGGHASTACNGVFYFDAGDDGSGRPRGFVGVPGTFTSPSEVPGQPVPSVYPDGRPNSSHTYQTNVFCQANGRFYKVGALSNYTAGGGSAGSSRGYVAVAMASSWPTNSWKLFGDPLGMDWAGEGDWTLLSPDGTKALYGQLKTGGANAWFFDLVTATWGNRVFVDSAVNPGWNGSHGRLVWDSIRNKALRVVRGSDQSGFGQMDINWATGTISNQQTLAVAGDTLGLTTGGQSVFFDSTRRFRGTGELGVIWVFGGRAGTGGSSQYQTITEIGYTNANTRTAYRYSLSGTLPVHQTQSQADTGIMNRHVFIESWRSMFVVTNMERGAFVIKLPEPTQVT